MSERAAIVGAGPAGFYAAEMLLDAGFAVDLFDRLPTPFGLVRSGVAPDHPKIKTVTRVFARTASRQGFRFFGGIELGSDLLAADLRQRYHVVLYAFGTTAERRLGIPGEELPGCHRAGAFVSWYNAHPDWATRSFELPHPRAVVVGNGNVALDVARMLVLNRAELMVTDVADHAIPVLADAGVEEVVILGRRGPLQAAFTTPELRELADLDDVAITADLGGEDLSPRRLDALGLDAARRRNAEILREYSEATTVAGTKRISFRFATAPVEAVAGADGRLAGVRVVRNRLVGEDPAQVRAEPTDQFDFISCGLLLSAVGYLGRPIEDLPFDRQRGVVANVKGRVVGSDGIPHHGEYTAGWVKRGPTGVIGTNKKDAAETVACILADRDAGQLPQPNLSPDRQWALALSAHAVDWDGWTLIDAFERSRGESLGRPRVKTVSIADMASVARRQMPDSAVKQA